MYNLYFYRIILLVFNVSPLSAIWLPNTNFENNVDLD
jgi:hypothetical protein